MVNSLEDLNLEVLWKVLCKYDETKFLYAILNSFIHNILQRDRRIQMQWLSLYVSIYHLKKFIRQLTMTFLTFLCLEIKKIYLMISCRGGDTPELKAVTLVTHVTHFLNKWYVSIYFASVMLYLLPNVSTCVSFN